MAFDPFDPKNNPTIKPNKNQQDIDKALSYGIDTEDMVPEAEKNNEVSGATAFAAGIGSGLIKTVEGVVSLGAELIDLGADTNTAAQVETFFDKINPLEEIAEQRAAGRISEALIQIGIPAGAGAKLATTLATKALRAKRAGKLVSFKAANVKRGARKAKQLNELSGKQRFAAVVFGGAAGETMVADVEKIGTLGDAFETDFGLIQQLDRQEKEDPSEDATRKLMNRFKFAGESVLITPFVYGAGAGAKALAKYGQELAYNSSQIMRTLDKVSGVFRARGFKPQELADAKMTEQGRKMADTNFAMEQVTRIDREVKKIFPDTRGFFNKSSTAQRDKFLTDLDKGLFEGDLKKGLSTKFVRDTTKAIKKSGGTQEQADTILTGLTNTREKFRELIDTISQGPGGKVDIPGGLTGQLKTLMGKRVKNFVGNTYKIFDDETYSVYSKYKPTQESVDNAANLFIRYAARNNVKLTKPEAESMVSDILDQVRKMDPKKETLPSFRFENLTQGATDPFTVKTFARTLEKETAGGTKEIKVIGKGSKIFRELFGETADVRTSIYEGMGRLSIIARKNQLFDEILDADQRLKDLTKADTPFGKRGFFFSSPRAAKQNFPNIPGKDIVKMDDYVKNYFKDGVLINRLSGTYTTREIAEAFGNVNRIQDFMRGESGGPIGKTFSWLWRNLLLTPKAGSQYAKTVLSIPTHLRNFFSAASFALANGTFFADPRLIGRAMKRSVSRLQLAGLRSPEGMAEYRKLLEYGVVNSNVRMGDLKNLMRDVKIGDGNIATDSILKPMLKSLGAIGRGAKKTADFMQKAYVAEDDFWKMFNFEVEIDRLAAAYAKAGVKKTIPQLEREAADIVIATVPNYGKVGEFVRAMRVSPFGNFMSFPSEIFRTGTNIARLSLKQMRDPVTGKINPFTGTNPLKGIGLKRLVGMSVATAALPYGLTKGAQAIFGVTNKEADAAKEIGVAPWSKNSQHIYFKDPDNGKMYYIDFSHSNVYDTLTRPFQSLLRNVQNGIENEEVLMRGFVKGVSQAIGETADPFISESIFTEALADIVARGGRTRSGKVLYTDETPDGEKIERIIKHLAKTQLPSVQAFGRTLKAIQGKPGASGQLYEIPYELAGVFGYRPIEINPKRSLAFQIYDFQSGQRNSRREFTGGPEGTLSGAIKTPKDLIERYYVANKALFDTNKKMLNSIKAARTLGVSEDDIYEIFEKRGLPKSTVDDLLTGQFKPFFPSEKIEERFEEIAQDTRQPNPFVQAVPTLEAMSEIFSNQNLYGKFNVDLEQFFPKQVPVEPQSMNPNPVVQPKPTAQVIPQTGLTQTETALLSPEEQIIRQRTRT